MKLIVLLPLKGSYEEIFISIDSVKKQHFTNFEVFLFVENSNYEIINKVKNIVKDDVRFNINLSYDKISKIKTIFDFVSKNEKMSWNDVIIELSCEFKLSDNFVFGRINKIFSDDNIWMSTSIGLLNKNKHSNFTKLNHDTIRKKLYGIFPIICYRSFLLKSIKEIDLKYNGHFMTDEFDFSLHIPMIEMCNGKHHYFIEDETYTVLNNEKIKYSEENVFNEFFYNKPETKKITDSPKYPKLELNNPFGSKKQSNNPNISIIIPTFNITDYLEECLNSTLDAAKKIPNIEILVGIDGCEKTLNYVLERNYDDRIKFYFFEQNVGPYVIKNTLAKLSESNSVFFFDSDDIMKEDLLINITENLSKFDCIKPKYFNFRNTLTNKDDLVKKGSKHFGEGVFAIKKELFLHFNGFEAWRCAADSDFMARLQLNRIKISQSNECMFFRRMHSNSLTHSKETGWGSKKRDEYIKLSKNKKSWGPLTQLTVEPCSILKEGILYKVDFTLEDFSKNIVLSSVEEKKNLILSIFNKSKKEYTEKEKQEIIQKRKEILIKLNPSPPQSIPRRIKGVMPTVGRNGIKGRNNFNP